MLVYFIDTNSGNYVLYKGNALPIKQPAEEIIAIILIISVIYEYLTKYIYLPEHYSGDTTIVYAKAIHESRTKLILIVSTHCCEILWSNKFAQNFWENDSIFFSMELGRIRVFVLFVLFLQKVLFRGTGRALA